MCSVQFSRSVVSDSLRPHESQHARPPCPSPTSRVHSDSRPSSRWCHQPFHPLLSPFPPAPNPSQHQSLFQWVSSSHEVAKVLEFQLQHHSLQRNPRADLLAVQGTLKSLLQHHSSKASIGAVLSILELSLLLFVLFECHSFGFFPLFPFAKIIVSLHISSLSTLTVCPHWQGNIRVCWEIRMGKDEFPRTPLSAGCPFHALLFYPQVRFCYWVFCVLLSFCPCLCPWCWPRLEPSTQASSFPSGCVLPTLHHT